MSYTKTFFEILEVLEATLKVMEDRGEYISQKSSKNNGETPTSHFVIQYLKNGLDKTVEMAKFSEKAEEMRAYFSVVPKDPNDGFLKKVYELMQIRTVSEKMIGFIVALPNMYEHTLGRANKLMNIAQKYSQSSYIGTIGIRDIFIVKVVDIVEMTKISNTTGEKETFFLYRVSDRLGNMGLFFKNEKSDMELWDCFEMRATPKKQEPNTKTGIKETQFIQVQITEYIGRGTEE